MIGRYIYEDDSTNSYLISNKVVLYIIDIFSIKIKNWNIDKSIQALVVIFEKDWGINEKVWIFFNKLLLFIDSFKLLLFPKIFSSLNQIAF